MLIYNQKIGLFRTSLNVSHTIVKSVVFSTEFWLFFFLHLLFWFSQTAIKTFFANNSQLVDLNWDFIKVVSGMTTFFLVFYSNQCYARYLDLYCEVQGTMQDLVGLGLHIRVFIGAKCHNSARICMRYVLCGIIFGWFETKHIVKDEDVYNVMMRRGFLKQNEFDCLISRPAAKRPLTTYIWACMALQEACVSANLPPQVQKPLIDHILNIKGRQERICQTLKLPVPFQYFHLLSVMIIMNLIMWGYAMGMSPSIFAPSVYFCTSFIFIGMVELSSELSDPFGADEVDFPLSYWISDVVTEIAQTIEDEYPGSSQALKKAVEQEERLPRSCKTLIDFHLMTDEQHASYEIRSKHSNVTAEKQQTKQQDPRPDTSTYSPLTSLGFGTPLASVGNQPGRGSPHAGQGGLV